MIGLDTGFFIELLNGNDRAAGIWKKIVESELDSAVSGLTLYEIKRISLKGALPAEAAQATIDAILAVCRVAWLDTPDVHIEGALLSHGNGIPAVDSLILASLLRAEAEEIQTTDKHLLAYKKRGIRIVDIRD